VNLLIDSGRPEHFARRLLRSTADMTKIWVLQHIHCETLGLIEEALTARGIAAHYIRSFEGEPVPLNMDEAAGLVVMGGPMGVYDHPQFPFLRAEMRLIEQAMKAEKPILGVCLGSQLLAAALGAEVKPGKTKEIGWHPVMLANTAQTDMLWTGIEPSFMAYHWHGDIFDLPRGATALAASALTQYQAFRYGSNVYGLLFHMEVTAGMIGAMVETFSDELRSVNLDGQAIVALAATYLPRLQKIGAAVFQKWAGLITCA
jgi:GMP synthase (glutamine-hydrolysing)